MRNFRVGDRVFNFDAMTHASYEAASAIDDAECVISFGCTDTIVFHGAEADRVWAVIKSTVTPKEAIAHK